MKAEYVYNSVYPDNPFIEAMPPMLSKDELWSRLVRLPRMDANIRTLDNETRLQYATIIHSAFMPLTSSLNIYRLIYNGILSTYAGKNTVEAVRQIAAIGEAVSKHQRPDTMTYATQANSFSILGVSGIGKSTTITRILDTIPQVIEHEKYHDAMLFCKQINYLCVQCPGDCSVKGMCWAAFAEIDRLIGSQYSQIRMSTMTLDAMITKLTQLCLTHHIGMIVVDEIQNVLFSKIKNANDSQLIKFLVQLMNNTGVCICVVGTPEVGRFFDAQPHLARRTRGLRLYELPYDDEFISLTQSLWQYVVVRKKHTLSNHLLQLIYRMSNGVPAHVVQLLIIAEQYAIDMGIEEIDAAVLSNVAAAYHLSNPQIPDVQKKIITPLNPQPKKKTVISRGRPQSSSMGAILRCFTQNGHAAFIQTMIQEGRIENADFLSNSVSK